MKYAKKLMNSLVIRFIKQKKIITKIEKELRESRKKPFNESIEIIDNAKSNVKWMNETND
jgi:hypothetical protein